VTSRAANEEDIERARASEHLKKVGMESALISSHNLWKFGSLVLRWVKTAG